MKTLILDYYRRKWPIIVGIAFVQCLVGLLTRASIHHHQSDLSVFGIDLQFTTFMGAFLLYFDLNRGAARAAASLPLTAAQIGRAWWSATVLIPTALMCFLWCAGAGILFLIGDGGSLSIKDFAISIATVFCWLGTGFTAIFYTNAGGFSGNLWENVRRTFFTLVWIMMFTGGSLLRQALSNQAFSFGLGAMCVVLTIFGFVYAGDLVQQRAANNGTMRKPAKSKTRALRAIGFGGLRRLIVASSLRGVAVATLLIITIVPMLTWMEGAHWQGVGQTLASKGISMTAPTWFVIVMMQTMPVILHLRVLRSVPISPGKLAGTLVLLATLPMLTMAAVAAGLISYTVSPAAALQFFTAFFFALAPVSFAAFYFAALGISLPAYGLLMLTMLACEMVSTLGGVASNQMGFLIGIPLVLLAVTLSFFLTRWAIMHLSRPYRNLPIPFANPGWGISRW